MMTHNEEDNVTVELPVGNGIVTLSGHPVLVEVVRRGFIVGRQVAERVAKELGVEE